MYAECAGSDLAGYVKSEKEDIVEKWIRKRTPPTPGA
jgi:hypothetical protein